MFTVSTTVSPIVAFDAGVPGLYDEVPDITCEIHSVRRSITPGKT